MLYSRLCHFPPPPSSMSLLPARKAVIGQEAGSGVASALRASGDEEASVLAQEAPACFGTQSCASSTLLPYTFASHSCLCECISPGWEGGHTAALHCNLVPPLNLLRGAPHSWKTLSVSSTHLH